MQSVGDLAAAVSEVCPFCMQAETDGAITLLVSVAIKYACAVASVLLLALNVHAAF